MRRDGDPKKNNTLDQHHVCISGVNAEICFQRLARLFIVICTYNSSEWNGFDKNCMQQRLNIILISLLMFVGISFFPADRKRLQTATRVSTGVTSFLFSQSIFL